MLTKFYVTWGTARALLITFAILFALAVCAKSQAWNLEMEYTGPGSEAADLQDRTRDRENREALDRVAEGSKDQRDIDRAYDYASDHAA